MKKKLKLLWHVIENIVYYIILIPLVIISLMVVYQSITEPDKIPDIFGYKMFMIMNDFPIEEIEYGDLVFTKNTEVAEIKQQDVVAYRNNTSDNVTFMHGSDVKLKDKIEGVYANKIPGVGVGIMFFQQPLVLLAVICIILAIGLVCYYIAQRFDEKDAQKNNDITR